jgi:hypothetical protein
MWPPRQRNGSHESQPPRSYRWRVFHVANEDVTSAGVPWSKCRNSHTRSNGWMGATGQRNTICSRCRKCFQSPTFSTSCQTVRSAGSRLKPNCHQVCAFNDIRILVGKTVYDVLQKAVAPGGSVDKHTKLDEAEIAKHRNDWTEHKNGQAYIQGLVKAWGRDPTADLRLLGANLRKNSEPSSPPPKKGGSNPSSPPPGADKQGNK